jgi:hypothetical protein
MLSTRSPVSGVEALIVRDIAGQASKVEALRLNRDKPDRAMDRSKDPRPEGENGGPIIAGIGGMPDGTARLEFLRRADQSD